MSAITDTTAAADATDTINQLTATLATRTSERDEARAERASATAERDDARRQIGAAQQEIARLRSIAIGWQITAQTLASVTPPPQVG